MKLPHKKMLKHIFINLSAGLDLSYDIRYTFQQQQSQNDL